MTEFRSCGGGGDRKLEIVASNRVFTDHMYVGRNRTAIPPPSLFQPSPSPPSSHHRREVSVTRYSPAGHYSSSSSSPWGLKDPEMKRKKRVAMYKAYTVEGKVKSSLRKSVRWIKSSCSKIVHGF